MSTPYLTGILAMSFFHRLQLHDVEGHFGPLRGIYVQIAVCSDSLSRITSV